MLDPLTSISLASAIVQFVDFGCKLMSGGSEIYKSWDGALTENSQLEDITTKINQLNEKVLASAPSNSGQPPTLDDEALTELAESCRTVASELLVVLRELKVVHPPGVHRRWDSLRKAIISQTPWNKDKIKSLETRLDKLQEQITRRVVVMMSERQHVSNNQQSTVLSLVERLANRQIDQLRTEILQTIEQSNRSAILDAIATKLSLLTEKVVDHEARDFLKSLDFMTRTDRQANITEAHSRTFGWIYGDASGPNPLRSHCHFANWLVSGNGIYWISGQAGSGKSTLMRHIFDNPQTQVLLQTWASGTRLVTAGHFFWNTGDHLQRSQRGLLQSLMYEILGRCRQLIPVIFPLRLHDHFERSRPWALHELLNAFEQLGNQVLPMRICFFVDGLDEYDGNHIEIIRIFKRLVTSPYIKICVSSRPWNIFRNEFPDGDRRLSVEEHTRSDIQLFVDQTLGADERYLRLATENAQCEDFKKQIVSNAQGVFLWVRLATNEILRGLGNDDDIDDLQRRLRYLPSDLEAYYQRMFDNIDVFYRQETAEIMLLFQAANPPLSVTAVAFYEIERTVPHYILRDDLVDMDVNAAAIKCQKRLNVLCQDILVIHVNPNSDPHFRRTVHALHGTVTEFLRTPRMQDQLAMWTSADFNPRNSLLKATLAQLKRLPAPTPQIKELNERNKPLSKVTISNVIKGLRLDPRSKPKALSRSVYFNILVADFIYYAQKIEKLDNESDLLLADEFDRVAKPFIENAPRDRGMWDSLQQPIITVGGRCSQTGDPSNLFLSLAVRHGLKLYVIQKCEARPQLVRSREGPPILYWALQTLFLTSRHRSVEQDDPTDMVRVLLQRGARPHELVRHEPALQGALITIFALFLSALYQQRSVANKDQYAATILLITYSATFYRVPWYIRVDDKVSPLTIFEIFSHSFTPSEAAHLETLLLKWPWFRFFKWWTYSRPRAWMSRQSLRFAKAATLCWHLILLAAFILIMIIGSGVRMCVRPRKAIGDSWRPPSTLPPTLCFIPWFVTLSLSYFFCKMFWQTLVWPRSSSSYALDSNL